MPTRQRTTHQVVWVLQRSAGVVYARAWIASPHDAAHVHLTRAVADFLAIYPQVPGLSPIWVRTRHGWAALMCGEDPAWPRRMGVHSTWTPEELRRLEAAYAAGGLAGCEEEFEDPSACR